MQFLISGHPTKDSIIELLKKRGSMTVDELSKELNITPMAIRQHLRYLEKRDFVEYIEEKQSVGRPTFLYRLTSKANDLFPKPYRDFIMHTFKDIEKNDGRKKVDDIFRWRKERLMQQRGAALADKKIFRDKVYALRDILETEGYFAEIEETDGSYKLRQFNCPTSEIGLDYREACNYELQLYKELLRNNVTRSQCIAEGNNSCTYIIPKR
jgi:predicted ArsR family transcriptional regulator